jgi:glycosyltransferase involved in cell wall biosynthesis
MSLFGKNKMHNNKFLITVIIPFFNRTNETIRAINSVFSQTYKYFEVLLINDNSTENISPIIEFIKDKKNIMLINLEKNSGPARARNEGIKYAKGDYIAFLDSDDEFLPEKLETQLQEMLMIDSVISHTSYILNMNNEKTIINSGIENGDVKTKFIYHCPVATPTVMLKRKYLIENNYFFNTDIRIGEDICFWLNILKNNSLLGIDKPLSIVNSSNENTAFNMKKQLEGVKNILKYIMNDEFYSNFDPEISKLAEIYIYITKSVFSSSNILNKSSLSHFQRLINSIKDNGFIETNKKIIKKINRKMHNKV